MSVQGGDGKTHQGAWNLMKTDLPAVDSSQLDGSREMALAIAAPVRRIAVRIILRDEVRGSVGEMCGCGTERDEDSRPDLRDASFP